MSSALKFFSTAILGILCLAMFAGCETSSSKEVRKLGKYNRNYDSYQQDFDFKSDDDPLSRELVVRQPKMRDEDILWTAADTNAGRWVREWDPSVTREEFDQKKYDRLCAERVPSKEAREAATTRTQGDYVDKWVPD